MSKTLYALSALAVVVLLGVLSRSQFGVAGPGPARPVQVTGAIRLADGRPVPSGVRVILHPVVERDFVEAKQLALELTPPESIHAIVARGEYRATLPRRGTFAMAVSAPGWSPYVTELNLQQDSRHDVTLSTDGFSFALDVQDAAAAPIPGAEVSVFAHHGQLLLRESADSRGGVSFKLMGGQYRFVFRADGFVPHARNILVLANEHRPLTLSRAAKLDVKVAANNAGEVELVLVDGLGRIAALGRTKHGAAHFSALNEGEYQVWAGDAGLEAAVTVRVRGGQTVSADLVLKERARVTVPLPQGCAPTLVLAAPTQDGRILHHRLPFEVRPSERTLTLNTPPLDLRAAAHCDGRLALFELPRSGDVRPMLEWRRPHSVRGRVMAPDGQGLSGAKLSLTTALPAPSPPWEFTAITRADGSFTVPGVPEGDASLTATHPRLGRVSRAVSVAASSPLHELHFHADYYVAGQVVDVHGAPVARATVAFASPGGGNASQTSDSQGSFRIGPVGADQGLLVAFVDGRLANDKPLLVSAENRDQVSLVLERSGPSSEQR